MVFGTAWLIVNGIHGQTIFAAFSQKAADFLALSDYGARFLFGNLADSRSLLCRGSDSAWPGFGFQFAFKVLPTIIFFGGFMGVLYYLGIMQMVIESAGPIHAMDGRHQRRRDPVVHRQRLCRSDRGTVAHQTLPR